MFACTWCAGTFPTRQSLAAHHLGDPDCGGNATVSSPLQSRYGAAGMAPTPPGEAILRRVRAPTCKHDYGRDPLVDADGVVFASQCAYCYSALPL